MKLLKIFLLISLLFYFTACGDNTEPENDNVNSKDDSESADDYVESENDAEVADNYVESENDTEVADNDADDSGLTPEIEAKYEQADMYAENVSSDLVAANTKLALKLFNELRLEGKNIMISPLSISIAMAMALNGAAGANLNEMKTVLEYDSMTMEDINLGFYNLINSLIEVDKDMILSIADSVWIKKEFEHFVKDGYLLTLTDSYSAQPYTLDFSDESSLEEINNWVSDNTNGKIKKIIDKIGSEAVMFLINAVYFNSAWTVAFDEEKNYEGIFTKSSGEKVSVEYMRFINQMLEYGRTETLRIVRLPYGRGKLSFYGIIPQIDKTINEVVAEIVENGFEKYLNVLYACPVNVTLPKFKFEYSKSLVEAFKLLGMTKAFDEASLDRELFENIAELDPPYFLYINEVMHKTFIEVSESGTEAAAVTEVEIDVGDTGDVPPEPEGFFGTRPFIYIIRDDRSGTILFMGKVEDPTVEK